jgi:prepilin-type N-terminal cleavage/methylation domain-containing protein
MKQRGFTIIELLAVVAFLIAAGVVLFFQIQKINTENENSQKKVAINAMYYSLEESFYPAHGYYPEHINDDTLTTMDAALLTDPSGVKLGEEGSAYRYEPKNCQDGKCKVYTLRATLTNEDDFVKQSRNTQ